METSESLHANLGKPYQRDMIFLHFPETGKSWTRMNIINQIISECGSIKMKTVTEVVFFYLCTDRLY